MKYYEGKTPTVFNYHGLCANCAHGIAWHMNPTITDGCDYHDDETGNHDCECKAYVVPEQDKA
jgi:hypothetical protein